MSNSPFIRDGPAVRVLDAWRAARRAVGCPDRLPAVTVPLAEAAGLVTGCAPPTWRPWRPRGRRAGRAGDGPQLAPLWSLLRDPGFQASVEALGGYSAREMGRRLR